MTMTGGCACGALRYRAEGEPLLQGLCHCRNCQRLSGAGHVGFICFPESAVTLEGDTLSYSLTGASGRRATRHACVMPGQINFYAGSLHDTAQFEPQIAIFIKDRPAWDTSSVGLKGFETVPTGRRPT